MRPPSTPNDPAPRCPRYPSLDLWRGVACLLVVVNHSSFLQPVPGPGEGTALAWGSYGLARVAERMWIGVPIFFVISGYCIAATADSSRRAGRGWGSFAVRRFRRIFPPYWACLAGTVVLATLIDTVIRPGSLTGLFLRPTWFSGWQWVGNLTLTEMWRHHLVGGPKGMYLGHAWTLCYEEQFYAVMGILLLTARRHLFAAAAGVTVACPIVAAVCATYRVPINGFFFDGSWTLFACGVLVYYTLNYATRTRRLIAVGVLAVGVVYSLRDPARLITPAWVYEQSLLVATLFALLLMLARPADGWLQSRVWLRPVFACGTMCYSLYLVHLPVTFFVNAGVRQLGVNPEAVSPFVTIPVGIAVSVAIARVFYLLVERRFINSLPELPKQAPPGSSPTPRIVPPACGTPYPVTA